VARVKVDIKKMLAFLPKAQKDFQDSIMSEIGGEIDAQISKGVSPVAGLARYGQYKPSYQGSIKAGYQGGSKRVRPVNLHVTGELRGSQKVKASNGKVNISYSDEKAKYHNVGTNNMVRRPLLPTNKGEEFSRVIAKFLFGKAKKVFDAVLRKS